MRVLKIVFMLIIINVHVPMVYGQARPPARVVTSKIVFQQVSPNQAFIGTLYYERISHVSSEVAGLVNTINVRTGDRIQKGKVLVNLDTQILEKEILIFHNKVKRADLQINHVHKNYKRLSSLSKNDMVSDKAYDDARFAYQDALLQKISVKTTLEKLLIQKRKSIIKAPFDGIVLEKNVDSGDWVQQGKPLISIGSVHDIFIRLPVAETLLKYVSFGQKVLVTINAYNKEMTGTIENLFPKADAKTKNVFLKIRIPSKIKAARNMSATVLIPSGLKQKLAMIPRDALVKSHGSDFVYTVKENKAVMLPVNIVTYLGSRIGADNKHFTQDMPVVVEGNERLRPDQAVTIVGE